jgi:hypothetical protein
MEQARHKYDEPLSGMNFPGGTAVFLSPYSEYRIWPMGSPRKVAMGTGEGLQFVQTNEQPAEFHNNIFRTDNKDMARALVKNKQFGDADGAYILDVNVIPTDIQEFWNKLSKKNQRRVALGLIDGLSADEVFGLIDEADQDMAHKAMTPQSIELRCPVPGCTAEPLTGPDATSQMVIHVHVAHPDWTSEQSFA